MPGAGFCQFDAGILDGQDKLTQEAKDAFVKAVKDELTLGTANAPTPFIPCGPEIPPIRGADMLPLEDESKFPDWHKNVLGMYEKIAVSLNLKGQFSILPICDPIALATQLQLNVPRLKFPDDFIIYGVALPALAVKLGFTLPVDLVAEFPNLLAQIQIPPSFSFPDFDFDLPAQAELALFAFPYPKFPGMLLDLISQMPAIFLKVLALDFAAICDVVLESKLFGDFDPDSAFVWVAANKVIVRKTVEMVIIAIVASTVGSSSGGIVGNLGLLFGFPAPPGPETTEEDPRDLIVRGAMAVKGSSWSKDLAALRESGGDVGQASLTYTQFMLPHLISPPPRKGDVLEPYDAGKNAQKTASAYRKAKLFSGAPLFIRGLFWRGGAQDGYFTKPYRGSKSVERLIEAADKKGASISFSTSRIPRLSKGDAILTRNGNRLGTEKAFVLTENFRGGAFSPAVGVEAGVADARNSRRPTAVEAAEYRFFTSRGRVLAGRTINTAQLVVKIFDAKKMVESD